MQISLHLMDDHTFQLDVDSEEWAAAFEKALRKNKVVVVRDSNGETLSVNPRMVICWQAAPDTPGS